MWLVGEEPERKETKWRVNMKATASHFLQRPGGFFDGLSRLVRRRDLQVGGLDAPNLRGVLRDGPVAGELPRGSDVPDHHLRPLLWILLGKCRTFLTRGFHVIFLLQVCYFKLIIFFWYNYERPHKKNKKLFRYKDWQRKHNKKKKIGKRKRTKCYTK